MNVDIITVCNYAYSDYTINLYESIRRCGLHERFTCTCFDQKSSERLSSLGIRNVLHEAASTSENMYSYGKDGWMDMMTAKMDVICGYLRKGSDVIYTDSDVVWLKDPIPLIENNIKHIEKNTIVGNAIVGHDMIFQVDSKWDQESICLCGGFYYCRSNPKTIKLFDSRNVDRKIFDREQTYINSAVQSFGLNVGIFPRELFPNGSYWYQHSSRIKDLSYVVHFNWTKEDKKSLMKRYNLWFV